MKPIGQPPTNFIDWCRNFGADRLALAQRVHLSEMRSRPGLLAQIPSSAPGQALHSLGVADVARRDLPDERGAGGKGFMATHKVNDVTSP